MAQNQMKRVVSREHKNRAVFPADEEWVPDFATNFYVDRPSVTDVIYVALEAYAVRWWATVASDSGLRWLDVMTPRVEAAMRAHYGDDVVDQNVWRVASISSTLGDASVHVSPVRSPLATDTLPIAPDTRTPREEPADPADFVRDAMFHVRADKWWEPDALTGDQ